MVSNPRLPAEGKTKGYQRDAAERHDNCRKSPYRARISLSEITDQAPGYAGEFRGSLHRRDVFRR